MATNQEYYGLESDWVQPNAANIVGTNRTNQWLTVYFGPGYNIGSVTYNAGSLASGLYNNKIPKGQQLTDGYMIEEPIDLSLSYCGLGNESVYSNIAYLEYKTGMCGNSFTAADNRSVTNFAFCQTQGSDTGFYIYNDSSTSGAASINGSRSRFAPYGINGAENSLTRANRNRPVTPYAQIPVRNTVFYPTLRVAANIQENPRSTSGMNIVNVDWEDYMNLQNSVNYTTHPYILRITMQAYTTRYVDDIDAVTGVPENDRTALGSSQLSGIAVLSPSSVADGEPMDIANPTQNLTDIYTYYNTRSKFATNAGGVMLFGYTSVGLNENDYINEPAPNVNVNASSQRLVFFPHPDAVLREAANNTNTSTSGWYYLEYYDDLVDWVMEQMACFGLFFTLDKATAARGALNDDLMFLGILEDGIGHGRWTSGEDNEDQPQWEWDTTNRSSYKPSPGPGPTPAPSEDDEYTWNTRGTKGVNAYRNAYAATKLQIDGFHEYINKFLNIDLRKKYGENKQVVDPAGSESTTIFIPDKDYMQAMKDYIASISTNSNPALCVVDLIMYPFRFTDYGVPAGNLEDIKFGIDAAKYRAAEDNYGLLQAAIQAKPLTGNTIAQIDLGSTLITPKYNDFRDYKPYTTCEVTIPYHGTVSIDTADFMGYELGVLINVDVNTGLSTAYITKNGVPRLSIPGSMGIHVPLTAINSNDYFNQLSSRGAEIANTKIDQVTGIVSGVQKTLSGGAQIVGDIAGAATGNTSGLGNLAGMGAGFGPVGMTAGVGANIFKDFSGVMKTSNTLKAMEEQLEHLQVNPSQLTSYTSELGFYEMQRCRITYHRCIMNSKYDKGKYGKTVGFATNETGQIKNFAGYAKFSNAILNNGSMLEEEKAMILDKLESGVIIVNKS